MTSDEQILNTQLLEEQLDDKRDAKGCALTSSIACLILFLLLIPTLLSLDTSFQLSNFFTNLNSQLTFTAFWEIFLAPLCVCLSWFCFVSEDYKKTRVFAALPFLIFFIDVLFSFMSVIMGFFF